MTIERCIETCDAADYKYAGLEFGNCDSVIQLPGEQVEDTECAMTCSGDATQTCGGPSRINVFDSGRPAPETVQTLETPTGTWDYTGCYTDSAAGRTLSFGINIPGGATIESCSAACTASSSGPFPLSGVENRNECWCGHELGETALPVDDNLCRGVCTADHSQFCGNANRISVYTFTPSAEPPPGACEQASVANFTLVAEFKEPEEDGPASVPLKVIAVEMASNVIWTILSVRIS
ncbi:WSC-domain-containing protein [Coprinellus micaceus]|uniref:WSC-domain-containing protein n=1 Tax=Coprinellus micaceus TaxID=71717 RepID=A0A4Y7SSS0_COPMI|nr:WSC-domain-containing protein [Coprinellus micaceus]